MSEVLTIEAAIAKGMGHSVTGGAFSTGTVGGGAGTILLIDEPDLIIGVPANVCIRPLRVAAQVQAGAIATDADETEILVAVDSLGLWTGDGTFTAEQPSNMRTDLDKGSMCQVGSAVTGAITTTPGFAVAAAADPVLDMELARAVLHFDLATAAGQNKNSVELLYEPKHPIYIIGPATLIVYTGGTVATVGSFVQASWIEGTTQQLVEAV